MASPRTTPKTMTIGQLAAAAGVHVETVRYYQRLGLLNTPDKPPGAFRRYSGAALERLTFIRSAQQLGFSLGEVAELLAVSDGGTCERVRAIAEEKLVQLGARVEEIDRIRARLRVLIEKCGADPRSPAGPIILSLLASEPRSRR
jgi:MerR family mercuric resistance operon transcriptional regulator